MTRKLLAIRLRSVFGSLTGKNGKSASKGKVALVAFLFLLLGGCFSMFSFAMAFMFAPIMVEMGLGWLYFSIFNLATFSLIFIFSIFETKSELYECRDNELLLSMPIKVRDIIFSRVGSVLVINYIEAAIILLPAIIVFAAYGGGAIALIGSLLVGIMIPLIATALASFVGYLVALISSRLKKNSFVTLGLYLVFFALYFVFYYRFIGNIESIEENPEASIGQLGTTFGAMGIIGDASLLKPLPLLIVLAVTALSVFVAYLFISKFYISIITRSDRSKRVKYEAKKTRGSSSYSALVKKEYARLFSSAAYMMNAGIGVIFEVVLAVLLLVYKDEVLSYLYQFTMALGVGPAEVIPAYCVAILSMLSSTVMFSASALSLEGKSFWIVRTAPINPLTLIFAKLTPHVVISSAASLVSSVIFSFALGISPIYLPFVILIPILVNIMYAQFGLVMNIAMPKFDFDNEAQVVKQSGASTIAMLVSILFSFIYFGVLVGLSAISGIIALVIAAAITVILNLIFAFILTGSSLRKLSRI